MKIPARVIGLLVAGAAAPYIAGCAADTKSSGPSPVEATKTELAQGTDTAKGGTEAPKEGVAPSETPASPPSGPQSTSSTKPDAGPPQAEDAGAPEDPCPPCGRG
jgi:hypothetical protein